ncbi:alpha/beta-hydrolase [Xylariaceae sp. FL1019]|nr:alpha/beta-hydrolase [Xylariaceae sp. FL1019]
MMKFASLLRTALYGGLAAVSLYSAFLALLTLPLLQNQVIYLNAVTLTWFQDVNVPEQWGFLRNQVTPFTLKTADGHSLHAWHVLPLKLYQEHEAELIHQSLGHASDITQTRGFKLLRDNPDALLVLYFHGAGGTLGSGWRPPSYRAMSALAPDKIHTLSIDYRGFGCSTGTPSEAGLLADASAVAEWAMNVAGIPPSRIVLFGQSLGTAVSVALALQYATLTEPILFSGLVLVAPMANVQLLTATYSVAGIIPILGPVARFPKLLAWLNTFIRDKWRTDEKLAELVRVYEHLPDESLRYHITFIHAKDDYTIPWVHSDINFWYAVNASTPAGVSTAHLEDFKASSKVPLGAESWNVEWKANRGRIREHILQYGLHDRIMSYPVVSRAIMRAFDGN